MSEFPPPADPSGFSNYPRYGFGPTSPDPYRRPPGVYFDQIGQAWSLVQANLATWIGAVVLVAVIRWAVQIPIAFISNYLRYGSWIGGGELSYQSYAISWGIGFIPECATNVLGAGLMLMGLKTARCEPVAIGDIFRGFTAFGSLFLASILTSFLVYFGIALVIIPGLFVLGLVTFVPLLILDRNLSPVEAIVESYRTLRNHAFAIFALVFLACLVIVAGYCVCCVGALFAYPVFFVTLGLAYNNFYPRIDLQAAMTPIGVEPPR